MRKYQVWNKTDAIYTSGVDKETQKSSWTAEEYISTKANWAGNPNAIVVVGGGVINGLLFLEFNHMVDTFKNMGYVPTEGLSPQEILDEIEAWEIQRQIDMDQEAAEKAAQEAQYINDSLEAEQTIASEMAFDNMMKYN